MVIRFEIVTANLSEYDVFLTYIMSNEEILTYYVVVLIRRLMGSTDQADPSCFYFRIS